MTDGTQFATAVLAITFSVAILVSSQLFLGYRSTKNTASASMFDLLRVAAAASTQRTANAVWIRKAYGR
jgi:hypothetical protein